jgi:hypothetical protein
MRNKKLIYSEGDCFVVPLRGDGFGRGVVSRMDNKGLVFGYFFGPCLKEMNDAAMDNYLSPEIAVLSGIFGDLGLIKRAWPVIGKIRPWSRVDWPLPKLARVDKAAGLAYITDYDENELVVRKEVRVKLSEIHIGEFPEDCVMGYGSVEIRLTKLLR